MAFEDSTELKFQFNDLPVCPFCEYEWDWDGELLNSNRDEIETHCPSCEKAIQILPHYEVTFSTYRSVVPQRDAANKQGGESE